jgi:glycine dehydrogenase subunit 2
MTIYFPLVVHGAMLVEPTETETRETLDAFVEAMRALAARAKAGSAYFHYAPRHAPRRRLDETRAARHPVLRWRPPEPEARAAE